MYKNRLSVGLSVTLDCIINGNFGHRDKKSCTEGHTAEHSLETKN